MNVCSKPTSNCGTFSCTIRGVPHTKCHLTHAKKTWMRLPWMPCHKPARLQSWQGDPLVSRQAGPTIQNACERKHQTCVFTGARRITSTCRWNGHAESNCGRNNMSMMSPNTCDPHLNEARSPEQPCQCPRRTGTPSGKARSALEEPHHCFPCQLPPSPCR